MSDLKNVKANAHSIVEMADLIPGLWDRIRAGEDEAFEIYFSLFGTKATVTSITIPK